MKIEKLLEYARHRQILEVRIIRDETTREPCRLHPLGLMTPQRDKPPADRTKKPYVLCISWSTSSPRFENVGDDQLLPLHEGDDHTELDPAEALPLPWWTEPLKVKAHKRVSLVGKSDLLIIGRDAMHELAVMEAIGAFVLTEGRARFQYARGDQDEVRGGQFVGLGGKGGHLLYILDDDRTDAKGAPQLRSFKHGNIRGLIVDPAKLPVWDGEWKAAEVAGG